MHENFYKSSFVLLLVVLTWLFGSFQGRTHIECQIFYPAEEDDNRAILKALIKLGFWPLTHHPTTAISIKLLSLLQCLTLECQVSAQGFVSAIEKSIGRVKKVGFETKEEVKLSKQ